MDRKFGFLVKIYPYKSVFLKEMEKKIFCAKKYRPRQNSNPRPLSLTPPALPLGHPLVWLYINIFDLYPDDQIFRFFQILYRGLCSTVRGGVKIVKIFKLQPYMSYSKKTKFFQTGVDSSVMSLVRKTYFWPRLSPKTT